VYEPKWDGFRALVVRDREGADELWSRHGRPLGRYFPEVVEAISSLTTRPFVLDGEILVRNKAGTFDFAALLARLHPAASRVERLRRETPALFVAFDIVRHGEESLFDVGTLERRAHLERLLADVREPLAITPMTHDVAEAAGWLERFAGGGIDGVVAKAVNEPYRPGQRAMLKVKRAHTAECVVAGFRWLADRPAIGSVLLALYDNDTLRHVGVVSSFTEATRETFLQQLSPLAMPLADHPWARGFLIDRSPLGRLKGAAGRWTPDMEFDWVPLRPDLVAEVSYDRFDGDRFRHPARFLRWRPDRDARSCTFDQLEVDHRAPSALVGGEPR
jgi:ATP-dependent DNA ligase